MRTWLRWSCAFLICIAARAQPPNRQAEDYYQRSEYRAALDVLARVPRTIPADLGLAGRCHFMLGELKPAITYLEKAVQAEPRNSGHHHWLGRAYGRRAETSSFVTAAVWANKARRSFETAVSLDPRNAEALNDLFEYCLAAPRLLGGGLEKAVAIAERIRALDPIEYQYALAKLAEKQKNFAEAESHFRAAAELAPDDPGRIVDVAEFLERRGRIVESDRAFQRARRVAPQAPLVIFEQAKTYVHSHRNLDSARNLLITYRTLALKPGDPPRDEAEKLLSEISR